jgi:hypothetical protein
MKFTPQIRYLHYSWVVALICSVALSWLAPQIPANKELITPSGIKPWSWSNSCTILLEDGFDGDSPCPFVTRKTDKSILLLGDSHAASFSYPLHEIAKKRHMSLFIWTQAGCPYVSQASHSASIFINGYPSSVCLLHNKKVARWIAKNRPNYVVYNNRSAVYYSREKSMAQVLAIQKAILGDIGAITQGFSKLIVIGPTLEYRFPTSILAITMGIKPAPNQLILFEDYNLQLFAKLNGTNYFSSINSFCSILDCYKFENLKPYFWDSNHLNSAGAEITLGEFDFS